MLKYFAILFLSISISQAQSKIVSGIVVDDLGIPIHNVSVQNSFLNVEVKSDCNGKYQIQASKKDTLAFNKSGYFKSLKKVTKFKNNKIMLGFDYRSFVVDLESNENMSESIRNAGQPLFIVDRKPVEKKIDYLDDNDVETIKVLKGEKAVEYFGDIYTKNGVVMIFTNCDYKLKLEE